MPFALFFDLHSWMAAASLGFARLAPVFFMLPFLNTGVLSGAPRIAVIILVAIALWPSGEQLLPALDSLAFYGLMLREVGIGVAIGCPLCWPFWVLHGMGNLIDNQRGAMLSNTVDPANGVDTSELANFLNLFAAAVFLEGGGMRVLVETFHRSYALCSPLDGCTLALAPMLALLARFAPQMNAFSVSLTIKSAIALLVLLLFFGTHLPDEVLRLGGLVQGRMGDWLIPGGKD